jgi:uroporphyrinogen decarboxylase
MPTKRELVLSVVDDTAPPAYTPAAFFLHFDAAYQKGLPAIEKHLEYFKYTGMDFIKIQFEHKFPYLPGILKPADWANIPFYDEAFFAPPLEITAGLVKAAGKDALVVQTLYSPFMCAGHSTSPELLTRHLQEDPVAVARGLEIITASLMGFVKACIKVGIDGFYASTQGGEAGRFANPTIFHDYIKPFDVTLMQEARRACPFNILHVCDYNLPYSSLDAFTDMPGQVTNCSLELTGGTLTPREAAALFMRPFMGGLNRKGILATGAPEQVSQAVRALLQDAPERFILAADCTVPAGTPWENLRAAINTAHTRS